MSAPDDRIPAVATAGALAGLGWMLYALPALTAVVPALRAPLGVADSVAGERAYALTFDDGPHPQGTPAVLDALSAASARATFFLVGEQVLRNPSLAGEIVAAGHDVALHCHRHRNLLRLSPGQVRDDLERALSAIATHAGAQPRLYRPPYGILNASALAGARMRGWRTLLWSHWGRDWEASATASSIASLATAGAGAGSVILLHDADDYSAAGSWRNTAAALPRIIETMAARGLEPQPA
jgi:peptidoglycan-N-acetylglucosamine deacetylase